MRNLRSAAACLLSTSVILAVSATLAPAPATADTFRREIVNVYSGLRADVIWGSTAAHQGVFLWGDNTSASQEYDLLSSDGTWFRIRARHSAQCLMLDWRGDPYGNGTAVIQYPYCGTGYAPAEWRWQGLSTPCNDGVCSTGGDHWTLVNRATGRCLDARNPAGGRPPVQAILQQWDCVTSTSAWNLGNQSWDLRVPGTIRID